MASRSSKTVKQSKDNKESPDLDPNSSSTPENFEKELKELAKKAQDETWTKSVLQQVSVYVESIALVTLIAIYSNVSQLALSPVYGSIPSAIWHSKLIMAACFTGWSSNLFLNRLLPFKPAELLPVIAIYIPTIQFFLYKASSSLVAEWGPLVTEALTLFPLMTITAACVANGLEDADFGFLPKFMADAAPGLSAYALFKTAEQISGDWINGHIGRTFLNTRLGMEIALGASYAMLAPSKLLLLTIPALLHTALLNTHVPTSTALASLNESLKPGQWVVLDRKESLTGYISVVDSLEGGFRVMRCDHSLLGGEWVKYIGQGRFKGNQVAEPIYGVFAMLEAVRLVEMPEPIVDSDAKALVM